MVGMILYLQQFFCGEKLGCFTTTLSGVQGSNKQQVTLHSLITIGQMAKPMA
jgi:hypothetical protein